MQLSLPDLKFFNLLDCWVFFKSEGRNCLSFKPMAAKSQRVSLLNCTGRDAVKESFAPWPNANTCAHSDDIVVAPFVERVSDSGIT
jgi:hypothetical protein